MKASPVRPLAVMVGALLPTALLTWYLGDPAHNQPIVIRLEHFVITPRRAPRLRCAGASASSTRSGPRRGEVVVQFGMGLHTGDVVVGAIGLPERSQYDAIGDAVNTASRMESLTKEFQVDAILSRDTAERLREDGLALRPLGEAHVKGKANPIEVFTLG